ncbi:tRNA:m(4)X modification enzyme TRM13 homolog [Pipra filicauda]|uniref:tRNA:m(4)X modification enzyme TRM13 n=1 Tax=Pipra filicauda TaxID=649802 RepID=A0A6J2I9M6_9PASS|nr:tRNA:m(4)X modification enzyme TRM13 homolog [Pipra filicauda]XP_051659537.1 tRNA:m(4)X modification enzyme TRM13 homolog isoform X1 [Manacus candei]
MEAQGPPGAAMAAAGPQPGRCGHFVERKGRFCRMVPAPGRRFCGEHGQEEEQNDRKRIPCPLDPKHTVYEDQLQKHLKKCNSREKPKPVYFVQDINAGLKDVAEIPEKQVTLSSLSSEELQNLIVKLKKASNGLELHLKEEILSHQALQEALNDPKNGESAFKHLKQQASILGNMERLHLLGPGRCFVEFGAGRGKLSHWVDVALQNVENVQFLLVERATTRFKVDGKHKRRDSIFERLQVDIQHLCLSKVPILEKKKLPVVGIGKHLCGAATDLALRCLVESYSTCCGGENEEPAAKRCRTATTEVAPDTAAGNGSNTEDHKPVAGIVIALCCHHKCDWTHYVGREFFKSVGLGAVEFHYFQRMSSWATCGMRETTSKASTSEESEDQTNDTEEHEQTFSTAESGSDTWQGILTVEERKEIGCLCKRLIDHGRIEYLQQQGYKAALQYYTESAVSLENVLLTAVPSPFLITEPTT